MQSDTNPIEPVEPPAAESPEALPEPILPPVPTAAPTRSNHRALWLAAAPLLCLAYITFAHQPQPAPRVGLSQSLDSAWQAYRGGDLVKARQLAEESLQQTRSDPRAAAEAQSLLALTQPQPSATPEVAAQELTPSPTPMSALSPSPTPSPQSSAAPKVVSRPKPAVRERGPETFRPAMPVVAYAYPHGRTPNATPSPAPEAESTPEDDDNPQARDTPQAPEGPSMESRIVSGARDIRGLLERHDVELTYVGTGLAGDVLELIVTNRSHRVLKVEYQPGMMLVAERDPAAPALMISEPVSVLVAPGDTSKVKLGAYALDGIALPGDGRMVDYRVKASPVSRAVRLLKASQTMTFHPRLEPALHRRAATQLALWEAANVALDEGRFRTALGLYARDNWARSSVMADVDPLLTASR